MHINIYKFCDKKTKKNLTKQGFLEKFLFFSKNLLTTLIFGDIIVNCIIIACTVYFSVQVGQGSTKSKNFQGLNRHLASIH